MRRNGTLDAVTNAVSVSSLGQAKHISCFPSWEWFHLHGGGRAIINNFFVMTQNIIYNKSKVWKQTESCINDDEDDDIHSNLNCATYAHLNIKQGGTSAIVLTWVESSLQEMSGRLQGIKIVSLEKHILLIKYIDMNIHYLVRVVQP